MNFEVTHRTAYHYHSAVTQSQHLIHLGPREAPRQRIVSHSIIIEPAPSWRHDFTDYFGNPVSVIGIEDEHKELIIHARSTIEVQARAQIALDRGRAWDAHGEGGRRIGNEIDLDAAQFSLPSPVTRTSDAVLRYARPSFAPGRPTAAAVWDLVCRIYDEFKFDSSATDVATPVDRVLTLKRGVCQDFAHLALACLRAMRVSARYVSGYLLTRPPPGKPKLQGADASHAWISVCLPDIGWVDFDPTNRLLPSDEHIAFAYGREYGDVSPVSGVLLGGGGHVVAVAVDVEPLDDGERRR
jgi:transglutaminase-like putative cysteine protease